ncbi:transmembrane protein 237-like [Tigriopus californicus]|uniref:transmembrane protein 237-like n=1 Tax=Tigriopus californicus TaxID=6832 RepID=UPI0027DA55F6|nr:transmembrane protein 237-like [Tigriopus californicus]
MGTTRNTNSEDPISTVSEQVDHKESRSKTIPPNRAVKQSSFDRENEATNQQLKVRDQKRKEKRQRRKKIKTATSFQDPTMASVIRGLEDDLHSVDGENEPISRVPTPVTPSNFPASNLVGKVYQQRGSGFTRTHPVKLGQSTATLATTSSAKGLSATEQTPLDFGLDFQKMFRSIGVFSHGFLAGLGFWQLVTVYVLSGEDISVLDFIDLYAPLAQPFHFTFYFLTVICMLSILDRYDIAQITWSQLQQLFTLKSGGIAIFVYASTLIITLTNVTLDDRLSLHRVNVTYLESLEYKEHESTFSTWNILNLCRCLGAILGWILVALRPSTDLLHKHLRTLQKFRKLPKSRTQTPTISMSNLTLQHNIERDGPKLA